MKTTVSKILAPIFALVLLVNFSQVSNAQTFTATLTGSVADSNKAAVAGARVAATNQATKVVYATQTDVSGNYTIPFLPIGEYVILVELQGFKKVASGPVKL